VKDFTVDKYNLHNDAAVQPQWYMECVKEVEAARRKVDNLLLELEEVTAELDLKIRSDPAKFGLDGVKERAVKSIISLDGDVIGLRKELQDAQRKLNVLLGTKDALEQRKQMIKVLAELYIGEYYSVIEVKNDASHSLRRKLGRRNDHGKKK